MGEMPSRAMERFVKEIEENPEQIRQLAGAASQEDVDAAAEREANQDNRLETIEARLSALENKPQPNLDANS